MDIRIGILNTARELSIESTQTAAEIEKAVTTALEAGAPYLTLADGKGKSFIVPTATLAYVEVGGDTSRRVGFVA